MTIMPAPWRAATAADSSRPVQLTRHSTGVGLWQFAPDSKRIYFVTSDTVDKDERAMAIAIIGTGAAARSVNIPRREGQPARQERDASLPHQRKRHRRDYRRASQSRPRCPRQSSPHR